ncbi:RNA polymerase subunit sigma-24, partial [Streptococcus anginosus]|nr:RNA polymerase subunit sigma-24 [Streptococcus anginosus]
VYYNCKNLRPERSDEEKERIKAFKKEYVQKFKLQHGYEPNKDAIKDAVSEAFPSNYNLSLDFAFENEIDEDKASVTAATAVPFDDKFEWS